MAPSDVDRPDRDPKSGIGAATRLKARAGQSSCRLGDEAVVLDLKQGRYFGMNDVAARVLELLDRPRSLAELKETLVAEYEVDPVRLEADLFALAARLVELGLIEIDGGDAA
jgi:coenzyme PQQ synthesis protein D (PqqD)